MIEIRRRYTNTVLWSGETLRGADLRVANLCGADLRVANLRVANLRVADRGKGEIKSYVELGSPDGWYAWAYQAEDVIHVEVGCRRFTLTEGRAYWADKKHRREVLAALDYAEAVFKLRG